MDNYICINGKKAELTEEQMKALGIKVSKNSPFDRVQKQDYYCIDKWGRVYTGHDFDWWSDREGYNIANYCTDKAIMEQRALHETLNRLLWRYSMEHDGDKIDWNDGSVKYRIYCERGKYGVYHNYREIAIGMVYFYTNEVAEAAIKEIIEPFMKAHPEFKW